MEHYLYWYVKCLWHNLKRPTNRIANNILNEDEIRILRGLLPKTFLKVKVENAHTTTCESNIGSPQGDSISGPLFAIYFYPTLQHLREDIGKETINVRDINAQWM